MITAREAFERWYSNDGEWPQAVARGTATEYRLASACAASDLLGHDDVRTTRRHYLTRGKRVGPTR